MRWRHRTHEGATRRSSRPPSNGHGQRPAGEHREPPVRCSVTLDGDRPTYARRSRQSQSPKAPRTITAKMLTQSGMLTPPAVTSTRKRTRSNCARAISQRRIAATSDACFFISALCPHRWPRPSNARGDPRPAYTVRQRHRAVGGTSVQRDVRRFAHVNRP